MVWDVAGCWGREGLVYKTYMMYDEEYEEGRRKALCFFGGGFGIFGRGGEM